MDALASALLALALRFAPPGLSPHSLVPMPECGTEPSSSPCAGVPLCQRPHLECRPPKWSRHHRAWVRTESASAAAKRYRGIAEQLVRTSSTLLDCSENGNCEPLRWKGSQRELMLATLTVALHESGLRRDIQNGEAPLGRGPNNEACLLQIDIEQAPRFAAWLPAANRERISRSRKEREKFALTLLGEAPEAMGRCFEIGMRMLARSRSSCASRSKHPDHGMFSMYGSGTTCNAPSLANRSRTLARLRVAPTKLRKQDIELLKESDRVKSKSREEAK